jgi:hypothetical protein
MLSINGEAHTCRFSSARVKLEDLQMRVDKIFGTEMGMKLMCSGELIHLVNQVTLSSAIIGP